MVVLRLSSVLVFVWLLLLGPAWAQKWQGEVKPGKSVSFPLSVSAQIWEVELELKTSLNVDLDLQVTKDGEEISAATSDSPSEKLILSLLRERKLKPGTYQVVVHCPPGRVVHQGRTREAVPFTLSARLHKGQARLLEPGTHTARLRAAERPYLVHSVVLPGGPVKLAAFSPTADVEIHLVPGPLRPGWKEVAYSHEGRTGYKNFPIETPPGSYTLILEGNLEDREEADITLWYQVEPEPPTPDPLPRLPGLPGQCQAVVQLMADTGSFGSGCLVSPDGHILTSYHVLEGPDGQLLSEGQFTVSWLPRPEELPLERFYARLVAEDKEGDLALLQISSDLRGQPVKLDFPYLEPAPRPALGEAVRLVGYPAQGWYHKRPGLMVASCTVAGFERHPAGTAVIVDGETVGGFSGGATLDREGRLVGLVRGLVSPYTFVWSLDRLPPPWWRIIQGRTI